MSSYTPRKRAYYLANKAQKCRVAKANRLKSKYGITLEEFEQYCLDKHNCCDICGEVDSLHVDHDHKTSKFRGALCKRCNMGLGSYRDKPELLRAAAEYLEKRC